MTTMRPFFTFFGGKWRLAPRYPSPSDTIVEPFAGSAGYSVRYNAEKVVLIDADPVIAGVWKFLINATEREILALPDIEDGATVDDYGLHEEARNFVGFWMNKGMTGPCRTPSKWLRGGMRPQSSWGRSVRERVASQVGHIRHWEIRNDDWFNAPDLEATWFVDPPYMVRGHRYRYSDIDYEALGEWCRQRKGAVIACENDGAEWLPFEPFHDAKTARSNRSIEVAWMSGAYSQEDDEPTPTNPPKDPQPHRKAPE